MAVDVTIEQKCPTPDDLLRLAKGRLPESRQAALTSHLDVCRPCQLKLDELASEGDKKFSSSIVHVDRSEPPVDSAYWNAISKAEQSLTTTHSGELDTIPMAGDLKLDFLQKTDTPGRIGRIGSFDVIRVVGRGGMGVVLHAFDEYLHRDVAIKVLDPQLANNEVARQRFCRESRAAASVSHDNIVAVYQVNEDEKSGLPYLVMQLVNGETLEDRLKRVGKLDVTDAVRVGMQAAAGLAAAHAAKLIHRDVKPANILLEKDGDKVKLTDFGLARAAEDLKLTRTGFVAGTPLYMAPEQARGDTLDARSDLFSLGTVMYETLAGRPPFDGKTPLMVLKRLSDDDHEPLRTVNKDVPPWLEEVIDKLLEKKPDDRFQSAAEVAELLQAKYTCLAPVSAEVQAAVCSLSGVTSKKSLHRKGQQASWRCAAVVAAQVLTGAILGAMGMWMFGLTHESRIEVPVPVVANAVPPAAPSTPQQQGPNAVSTMRAQTGAVWGVAVSGDLVASALEDGQVSLWDKATGSISRFGVHEGPIWTIDFLPRAKPSSPMLLVTSSDDGRVIITDVTKEPTTKKVLNNKISIRAAAVNASGTQIVTGDRMGMVRIWDLTMDDGKVESDLALKTEKFGGVINAVAFDADDMTVAVATTNRRAYLWEINTGKRRPPLEGHKGPVYGIAFSSDGKTVATVSWDHTIKLWDKKTGEMIGEIPDAHDEGIWAVTFSSCGGRLATAGQEGLVKIWDVPSRTEVSRFSRHLGTVHAVRYEPNCYTLYSGGRDGTVRVWNTQTAESGGKHEQGVK
jgi:eukaryotic-like serine/threonine-protein kinase